MEIDLVGLSQALDEIRDGMKPDIDGRGMDWERGCIGMAAECLRRADDLEKELAAERAKVLTAAQVQAWLTVQVERAGASGRDDVAVDLAQAKLLIRRAEGPLLIDKLIAIRNMEADDE